MEDPLEKLTSAIKKGSSVAQGGFSHALESCGNFTFWPSL